MQVSKWGNSLAVRLPKALVEELNLSAGDVLSVVNAEGRVIVVEKQERRKQAIARMTKRGWKAPHDFKFNRDEANKR